MDFYTVVRKQLDKMRGEWINVGIIYYDGSKNEVGCKFLDEKHPKIKIMSNPSSANSYGYLIRFLNDEIKLYNQENNEPLTKYSVYALLNEKFSFTDAKGPLFDLVEMNPISLHGENTLDKMIETLFGIYVYKNTEEKGEH